MTIHPHMRQHSTAQCSLSTGTSLPLGDGMRRLLLHWPWGGFGTTSFHAPPMRLAAPAVSQTAWTPAAPPQKRAVLAPATLDSWCREPLPTALWLDPNVAQTIYGGLIHIYVAGCRGLLKLSRQLGGSMFKIGTTQAASPEARMGSLISCRYGSRFRCDGGWTDEQEGFDNWKEERPVLVSALSPASPVSVMQSSLLVRLPVSLSPGAFDQALNQRLRTVAVDRWVRQDAIQRELALHGICANLGIRGKKVAKGLIEEVSEIFFFRRNRISQPSRPSQRTSFWRRSGVDLAGPIIPVRDRTRTATSRRRALRCLPPVERAVPAVAAVPTLRALAQDR